MTDPGTAQTHAPSINERLIVALDVETADAAREIVSDLAGVVETYKIGLQLFSAEGSAFVRELVDSGTRVFLDLKFHDIPNTVAMAGIEAARLGVWMFNVHASGGGEMMKRTAADVGEFCFKSNLPVPLIIGVTVLTSSDVNILRETGIGSDVEEQVVLLSRLTRESGLDGVVASSKEIQVIRQAVADPKFLIVTPGIRPLSATNDDQRRVMTPGEAISNGSSYLVVGRPIVAAADRRAQAEKVLEEMNSISLP